MTNVTIVALNDIANAAPAALVVNTPVTIVNITNPQAGHYWVSGDIDLGNLLAGDVLVVTESIGPDGVNPRQYNTQTYYGPLLSPLIELFTKPKGATELYSVTLLQTAGVGRVVPYFFVQQVASA